MPSLLLTHAASFLMVALRVTGAQVSTLPGSLRITVQTPELDSKPDLLAMFFFIPHQADNMLGIM